MSHLRRICKAALAVYWTLLFAATHIPGGRVPDTQELAVAERFLKLPPNPADKLTRWQQYAQALLASNEMMYVD